MGLLESILKIVLILLVGFTGGFYLALSLQNQIGILAGTAIILALLTWLGSGADLLGLLREWYKDKREEEKTPVLEFDGIFVNNESVYFLRVRKTKGEGMAESCQGFFTVEGTDVSHSPTVWSHAEARSYDIGDYMDLRLFRVEEEHLKDVEASMIGNDGVVNMIKVGKSILFPSAHLDQGLDENRKPYDQFTNRRLTVTIVAKKGHVPKPFTQTIAQILKEAKRN